MSLVYVQHQDGTPLMPTYSAKARHLLKADRAVVTHRDPFTIRLSVPSGKHIQPVTVGVDLGAVCIGVAATGNDRVLYQGEVILRNDIARRMDRRRMYRRGRRSRKCRYRQPRFNNRASSRRKGRLPPSIQSKVDTTVKAVRRVSSFLPVSQIRVEVTNFDTQAMRVGRSKLPGWAYQRGPQYGYENVKMFVRARDNYTCQYCGKKSPPDLEVDHIVPRSRGGSDRPDNLIASCHVCNQTKGNRTAGEFGHSKIQKRVKRSLRAAAHTQTGKTAILRELSQIAPIETTFGYVTKVDRQALDLPKSHYIDAVVIASQGESVKLLGWYEACRAIAKGVYRKRRGIRSHLVASLPREVFGFRLWDQVILPDGQKGFVKSRRSSGYFTISNLEGKLIKEIAYQKLRLVGRASTLIKERKASSFLFC